MTIYWTLYIVTKDNPETGLKRGDQGVYRGSVGGPGIKDELYGVSYTVPEWWLLIKRDHLSDLPATTLAKMILCYFED